MVMSTLWTNFLNNYFSNVMLALNSLFAKKSVFLVIVYTEV